MISHFLLAVCASENGEENPLLMTFCKVGSGYSDKELQKVCQQLNKHWKTFDPTSPPREILFSKGYREKPDVWIEPQHSIVVQIKGAEITVSDRYHTGKKGTIDMEDMQLGMNPANIYADKGAGL